MLMSYSPTCFVEPRNQNILLQKSQNYSHLFIDIYWYAIQEIVKICNGSISDIYGETSKYVIYCVVI